MAGEVTHREAMEDPSLRQSYLDYLVESYGRPFSFIDHFLHLTEEGMLALKSSGRLRDTDPEKCNMACVPNGKVTGCNSTVYLLDNNFNNNFRVFYQAGVPTEEIAQAHQIELCVHEAAHAEHFKQGINGFDMQDFGFNSQNGNFTTEQYKFLFMIASEIDAHSRHLTALGKLKARTNYLAVIQRGFIEIFRGYMLSLPRLAKEPSIDSKLVKKIFERYNGLRINNPSYDLMVIP